MVILVYDIAADKTGALTILQDFYRDVRNHGRNGVQWVFVVSTPELKETENIAVFRYPWIKKSWLHRLYFDEFLAAGLAKKSHADLIFSMQNMPVPHCGRPQIVYFHQPLQFSPVRFSLFRKEERKYWFRQTIICNIFRRSLKKADRIIVQTKWMKNAISEWIPFDQNKISVVPPTIDKKEGNKTAHPTGREFIYPAAGGVYKNHDLIVDACILLEQRGIRDYHVIFTVGKNENPYCEKLYRRVTENRLKIDFSGILPKSKIDFLYARCVLIFPSYLETFGLPLLEARSAGTIVLASDLPFSREILEGYPNACFFGVRDAAKLAGLMEDCMEGKIVCRKVIEKGLDQSHRSAMDFILKMVDGEASER